MVFINRVVRSLIIAAALHLHIINMKKNPFTSVFDCLFYDKHILKCEHVLTVICQQSVNKYQTMAADLSNQENRIRFVVWNRSMLDSKHSQIRLFRHRIEQVHVIYSVLHTVMFCCIRRLYNLVNQRYMCYLSWIQGETTQGMKPLVTVYRHL